MIAFNLSVDFELGWGDLDRLARDDGFYRRVIGGLEQSANVADILNRSGVPSTWGVVGGCCCASREELQERSPRGFELIEKQLDTLALRRTACAEVLFCPKALAALAQHGLIEIGSHGFMHLLPAGVRAEILQDDVTASVRVLKELLGKDIESFIPPQNYHWPDSAFERSDIRYIRHTPRVFGRAYSDPGAGAKIARLWNDLVLPVNHVDSNGQGAQLFFLRLDRGVRLWRMQMRMIRRLIESGSGSVFCYTHPHNLDTPLTVRHFAELCEIVALAKDQGRLKFRKFLREPGLREVVVA